jgi:putative addiction module component (TIGR02574 family)
MLAECLLESLSPDDELTDEQWLAELERRYEEYQADPTIAVSWDEVKRMSAAWNRLGGLRWLLVVA